MHIHCHTETKLGMKTSPVLYIWWDKICFIFLFRLCRLCMCWHEASHEQRSWIIWSFNLSHPACGCLLMFGWSWQDFCIHSTAFHHQVNLGGLSLLAGWDQKWSGMCGFSCGCTCTTHRDRQTHTGNKKKMSELQMFPVNAAGCTTNGTDGLPVVQLLQREAHELCIVRVPPRKQPSSLESDSLQPGDILHSTCFWNIKDRNRLLGLFYRTEKLFFLNVSEQTYVPGAGCVVMAADTKWVTVQILTHALHFVFYD